MHLNIRIKSFLEKSKIILPFLAFLFVFHSGYANGDFSFSVFTINETCDLDNGEIIITVTGDTTGVEFSIDGGINFFNVTHFQNLPSGDYLVFGRSADCRPSPETAQIARQPPPTVSINSECIDGFNLITLTPTIVGGVVPFTYMWDGPSNSSDEILTMVEPGEYHLTITDRLGCSFSDNIIIPQCCLLDLQCDLDAPIVSCENTFPDVDPILTDPTTSTDVITTALADIGISVNSGQCGALSVSVLDTEDGPSDCSNDTLYILRQYTITDNGSAQSCTQQLRVASALPIGLDNTASSQNLNCDEDIQRSFSDWIANHGDIQFTACSPDSLSYSTIPDLPELNTECNGVTEVTFVVTDQCGNTISSVGQFRTSDNEPPVINCPDNIEIDAEDPELEEKITNWRNDASSTDNCGVPQMTDDFATSLADPCDLDEVNVQFVSIDECDNVSDCIRTITIVSEDNNLDCPAELVISCGESNMELMISDWLNEATSSQGNMVGNDYLGLSSEIACDEPLEVTFTTDSFCGGDISCISTIRIVDNERPEITCPQTLIIDLGADNLAATLDSWLQSVEAMDCNATTLDSDFSLLPEDFQCSDQIPVSFAAIDACGLASNCQSMIIVENTSEIRVECPEAISVICTNPDLSQIVQSHMENISVESASDFEVSQSISHDIEQLDCTESLIVEGEIFVTDICESTSSCFTSVEILPDPKIYIPNVFSPDNDGLNDWFTVYGNESIDKVSLLMIYDRWGSLVFEATDFPINQDSEGWNGRIRNIATTSDVYTYHAIILDTAGNEILRSGSVQLLKK